MFIKMAILCLILVISISIGNLISKKFVNRVIELQEFKSALNIFKTKIKYTYEPIPDIFGEISNNFKSNISSVFENAKNSMGEKSAGEAWEDALDIPNLNINEEDKNVLKNLSKLLGKTDKEGQINEIEVTESFLNLQIKKAEQDRLKNEKMYKTLGVVSGVGFAIILI